MRPAWQSANRRNVPSTKAKGAAGLDMERVRYIADLLAKGAIADPWSAGLVRVSFNGRHVASCSPATLKAARAMGQGEVL